MRRLLGNVMLMLGLGLLAVTVGLLAYGEHARREAAEQAADLDRFERATTTADEMSRVVTTAIASGQGTATAEALARQPTVVPTPAVGAVADGPAPRSPIVPPSAPATPPSPTPRASEVRRVIARSIGLDAPVVFARVQNGEWEVPKFVAGHLQGTALPGMRGNVVLSGHNQSLSSGNVFAEIEKLRIGDEVTLRTNVGEVSYRISGRSIVANDDLSVVRSGELEEVTLITCTGTFNPLRQDYTHRLVVWGERAR